MFSTSETVQKTLIEALDDADCRVIALTGKWGTGKTYLWSCVRRSKFNDVRPSDRPIYVSLFGAKSANDLKLRLLQSAYTEDESATQILAKAGGGVLKSLAGKFLNVSLEDAVLLLLPKVIGGRLIVVDDVERKHRSFDVDEFLGFIDEYSERHNVRFLLVLNSDKLTDAETWARLHEKVIDAEIVLEPTAEEAFRIGAQNYSGPFPTELCEAVRRLGVNNIRVIRHILTTMNRVAIKVPALGKVAPSRVVPGTVLLTAIHYRGLANSIPAEYVLRFNTDIKYYKPKEKKTEEERSWDGIIEKLNISSADEYEQVIQDFLRSGVLDTERTLQIVARYEKDSQDSEKLERLGRFQDAFYWDPKRTRQELAAHARELLPSVNRFAPREVTRIVSMLSELNEQALAEEFVAAWIEGSNSRKEYQGLTEASFEYGSGPIHPKVLEQIRVLKERCLPRLSIIEALERIEANSGWGERERRAFRESTADEYANLLTELRGDQLAKLVMEHLRWVRSGVPDPNFQPGLDGFREACQRLVKVEPASRLTEIIVRAFGDQGLTEHLNA
jgi:hypothetical protein